jgi:hypothetical protein
VEFGQQIEFGFGGRNLLAALVLLGLYTGHSNAGWFECFVLGLWRVAVRFETFGARHVVCFLDSTASASAGN